MKVREWRVLSEAVERGVQYGVHRAYKHSEGSPPSESQIDTIIHNVMNEITEYFWFGEFEDDIV